MKWWWGGEVWVEDQLLKCFQFSENAFVVVVVFTGIYLFCSLLY